MDDWQEILKGGPLAAVGALATMVGGAILAFRKYYRNDQVQGAATDANVYIIDKLQALLKEANERADIERARADSAYQARNEAIASVAELKAQVSLLQGKVDALTASLAEALRRNGNPS